MFPHPLSSGMTGNLRTIYKVLMVIFSAVSFPSPSFLNAIVKHVNEISSEITFKN